MNFSNAQITRTQLSLHFDEQALPVVELAHQFTKITMCMGFKFHFEICFTFDL
jgi:hypothetical protein